MVTLASLTRSDLVKEASQPKTWDDMVKISERLEKEGQGQDGFVGGMSTNNMVHWAC